METANRTASSALAQLPMQRQTLPVCLLFLLRLARLPQQHAPVEDAERQLVAVGGHGGEVVGQLHAEGQR